MAESQVRREGLSPTFWRFWSGSAVSQLGDGVRVTALPLLAAAITRDPVAVASITAAIWMPWLLFGAVGGAIVDRVDRRMLMRNGQIFRTLVTAGLVAAVLTEKESIPLLAGVAFAIGVAEVMVDSALYSVVPRVVPEEQLETANGRVGAAELLGNELVGPPVGGFLFGIAPWIPFAVDCVSFGVSGVVLSTIGGDFRPDTEGEVRGSVWSDVRIGVVWLVRHRVLRAAALGLGAINFAGSAGWAVFVLFALQILDVSGIGFGLILSTMAIGGLLGSLLGARVAKLVGRAKGMIVPLVVAGLASGAVGLTSDPLVVGLLYFVEGLMIGIFNVIGRTLRQVLTPDRLMGRVTSGFRTFSYGMAAVGALAGGALADAFGLRAPFVIGGVMIAVSGAAMGAWINERSIDEARLS